MISCSRQNHTGFAWLAGVLSLAACVGLDARDTQAAGWLSSSGGTFSDGSHWSGGSPPTTTEDAFFVAMGTYGVDFTADAETLNLLVTDSLLSGSGPHVTFNLNGHTYRVTSDGGTFGTPSTMVAPFEHDDTSLAVLNGTLHVTHRMSVGDLGAGTLDIGADGRVYNGISAVVGGGEIVFDGSNYRAVEGHGIVNVNGTNAQWEIENFLSIGSTGLGEANVENGGNLTVNNGSILLGSGSSSYQPTPTGPVYRVDGEGHLKVSGMDSKVNALAGAVVVGAGSAAHSSLTVEAGGQVNSRFGAVGNSNGGGSTGKAVVTGNGSEWKISERLTVGSGGTQPSGMGAIEILNGGKVSADVSVTITDNSTLGPSSILVDGGELSTIDLTVRGNLTVQNGTVEASNRVLNLGGQIVNNGLIKGDVLTVSNGTYSGNGNIQGLLQVASNGILAPGSSPGTVNSTTGIMGQAGILQIEINDLLGTAGGVSGWDLWSVDDALTINATTTNPFQIDLVSLQSDNTAGALAGFNSGANYSWKFASAAGGILGFAPDVFTVNTTGFQNALNGGQFFVTQSGNDLLLNFAGVAVPEPSSLAICLIGIVGLALRHIRPRRRA